VHQSDKIVEQVDDTSVVCLIFQMTTSTTQYKVTQ